MLKLVSDVSPLTSSKLYTEDLNVMVAVNEVALEGRVNAHLSRRSPKHQAGREGRTSQLHGGNPRL